MGKVKMLGALVGDIIGSMYEFHNTKRTDFELFPEGSRFTDDSVMTLAVAKWLLEDEAHSIHYLIYYIVCKNLATTIQMPVMEEDSWNGFLKRILSLITVGGTVLA